MQRLELHMLESGCPDLNRGPLRPERSALTKLRHSPSERDPLDRGSEPEGCYPTAVRWFPASPGAEPGPGGLGGGSGRLATTLAIRRLSISVTRSSQPSTIE